MKLIEDLFTSLKSIFYYKPAVYGTNLNQVMYLHFMQG